MVPNVSSTAWSVKFPLLVTSLFRSFFQSTQSTAYILPCEHGHRQQGPMWTDSSEPLPQAHVVAHTHAASVLACMWGAATACIWPATAHGASLCTYTSRLTCTVVLPSCHLSDPCELFAPTSPHHHLSLICTHHTHVHTCHVSLASLTHCMYYAHVLSACNTI